MIQEQRVRNRKRAVARCARIDREIERFTKTAKSAGQKSDEYRDVAVFEDSTVQGLRLTIEMPKQPAESWRRLSEAALKPAYRWFYKRPGYRALELSVREDTPTAARRAAKLLDAGDEDAILGAYLLNGRPGHCHNDWDLLNAFNLERLREHIARKQRWIATCERDPGRRSLVDVIWPLRREVHELARTLGRYLAWLEREGLAIRPAAAPKRARLHRAA